MFPITFENVQKMFEKCSNFRNASFEVMNFLNAIKLFIKLNDFKIIKTVLLIGPGGLFV